MYHEQYDMNYLIRCIIPWFRRVIVFSHKANIDKLQRPPPYLRINILIFFFKFNGVKPISKIIIMMKYLFTKNGKCIDLNDE